MQIVPCFTISFILEIITLVMQVSPAFRKFELHAPLHFYKRPTLVPVFTNRKKSKEDFHFCENEVQPRVFSEPSERQRTLQAVRLAPPSPFCGNYTQHLSIKLSEL